MNRIWQQLAIAANWPVLASIVVLSSVGVLSIWAHSAADGLKQLIFIGIALGCMALFQAVNYQSICRIAWAFYVFSAMLILYTILPFIPRHGFGSVPIINGAHAWITFGSFSLQPAELMKIAFVLVLARYLRFRRNYRTFKGLLAPFMLAIVPLLLIMKQPDLGTALTFIPTLFVMLFVAGARKRNLVAIVGIGLALAPVAWLAGPAPEGPGLPVFKYLPTLVKPYQRQRVNALFSNDPSLQRTTAYQTEQALIAFGSGGVTGKGFGDIPVGQYVPEAHNDMIFSLVGEQFGFVGAAVLLAAYLGFFAAGIEIAGNTREPFGRLVAVGIVALLAGQTFLNLMVVLRLMPVTGITLPFVSYGGSSLIASFMAAGLLLNIGQSRPLVMAREAFEFE
jgi:cell division protein FtsW (lipid II flippase)